MERFKTPAKIVNIIKSMYTNPTFRSKLQGRQSTRKRQKTGIRQGCPLSPYLFLVVMTAIWKDIHTRLEIKEMSDKRKNKSRRDLLQEPLPFTEVLYADDTILIGHTKKDVEAQLQTLEDEAGKYGLNLNRKKCEHIKLNARGVITCADGTTIKEVEQARYLGVKLHNKTKPEMEIKDRIWQTTATWNRLHKYWKLGQCSKKRKLQVWNAVIRSKLIYALQTVYVSKAMRSKLNAFQNRGIRKILGWKSTYIERENTNAKLHKAANQILKQGNRQDDYVKQFEKVSKTIKKMQLTYFGHLLREPPSEPTRQAIIIGRHVNLAWKKRVGRPRKHWTISLMQRAWKITRNQLVCPNDPDKRRRFSYRDKKIVAWIEYAALWRLF